MQPSPDVKHPRHCLSATPRRFVHAGYAGVATRLWEATRLGPGVLVLTGAGGTGKTTLADELATRLAAEGCCVGRVANSQVGTDDLLRLVGFAFGLQAHFLSMTGLLSELEYRLSVKCRGDRPTVLMIDEAQDLAPGTLQGLSLLLELKGGRGLIFQILLCGRDGLRELIDRPESAQLRERILASCRLDPLGRAETDLYVAHTLEAAGWTGIPALAAEALDLIHSRTGGVPRLLNLTLGHLMVHGRIVGAQVLEARDVEVVLAHLGKDHPELLGDSAPPMVLHRGTLEAPLPVGTTRWGQEASIRGPGGPQGPIGGRRMSPGDSRGALGQPARRGPGWLLTGGVAAAVLLAFLTGIEVARVALDADRLPVPIEAGQGSGARVAVSGAMDSISADPSQVVNALPQPALISDPRPLSPLEPSGPSVESLPGSRDGEPEDAGFGPRAHESGVTAVAGSPGAPRLAGVELEAAGPPAMGGSRAPTPGGAQEVERLLGMAERAFAGNRLMVPDGDNAYRHYRAVLHVDPENAQARAGIQRILTRYRGLAQQSLRKGDLGAAKQLASRGLVLAPRDPELLAIKRKASKRGSNEPDPQGSALLARLEDWLRSGNGGDSHFLGQ